MYTCKPCNFTLHSSCSQLSQSITHPAHPAYSLSLLPTPAYSVGYFICVACDQPGHGFNYRCNQCNFDIHTVCASKPLSSKPQSQNNGSAMSGQTLMGAAAQGLVGGISKQVGKNFVRSVTGDDSNGSKNDDCGGNDSSSSTVDIIVSFLSGLFGSS
ncbi:hypothetical protein CRYUN_Cryun24cG0107800 [Craigia yunnanensis]